MTTFEKAKAISNQAKAASDFLAHYVAVGKIKTAEEEYDDKLQGLQDEFKQEKDRALAHIGLNTYEEGIDRIMRLQDKLSTLRVTHQATADKRKREHHRLLEVRIEPIAMQ